MLTASDEKGVALPFGAQVSNDKGETLGIVGQAGQVMLGTVGDEQTLSVRWGNAATEQCQLQFDVRSLPIEQGYRIQDVVCR